MAVSHVSQDFDTISAVYDETRPPLEAATIEGLRTFLGEHRWTAVLEVGVGTGRVARPLLDRGVRVVGVDASRGMLARARTKGLPNLVRGDAYHLPFSDGSFDAALFVHVLHILDRPDLGLREAVRVGHGGALAILDLPPKGARTGPRSPE
jgi:ubiquinone/menaquinone biosynthesis C-methylase UbiE